MRQALLVDREGEPALRLEDFLPYRLSIASNLVSNAVAASYEALFGLRIPEWRLIAVLGERGALTQAGLGEVTRMDKVTVSRAATALVERGLARREPRSTDRRSHLLLLTGEGRALYAQVAPEALAIEARLLADLDATERATLRRLLDKVSAAARNLDHRTGPVQPAHPSRVDNGLSVSRKNAAREKGPA